MRNTVLSLLSLATLFFISCDDDDSTPITSETILSGTDENGKLYQITRIDLELGQLIPNTCLTDNNITYFPNGVYEVNEGATKCDPNDPPAISGTWAFSNNDTRLVVNMGDSIVTWDVIELSESLHTLSAVFKGDEIAYTMQSR